jgi:hypothetical protein
MKKARMAKILVFRGLKDADNLGLPRAEQTGQEILTLFPVPLFRWRFALPCEQNDAISRKRAQFD